jgi:cellulose synthase/poly-beta-1,6-N-acetylglucosamine synthase-like glycosyltransferase
MGDGMEEITRGRAEQRPVKAAVVIPVYNGSMTIRACLDSLLAQDCPLDEYEVIVVENGSTDDTSDIVGAYEQVRLIHSDVRGASVARNVGIWATQAEIIAFTDADCVADPHWICALMKAYEDPTVGGVGGQIIGYDHHNLTLVESFLHAHSPLINFISGEGEFLPHLYTANASFRRCTLLQVGGFNPHLVTAEDVDLSWRVQLKTPYQLVYCDDAVIHHHHRATVRGMARQYRQYGFGEILLDTMYKSYPGYPRAGAFQWARMLRQALVLPHYVISGVFRSVKRMLGEASVDQQLEPAFSLIIETNNLFGKLEGLLATRWMSDSERVLHMEGDKLIDRYFPVMKE